MGKIFGWLGDPKTMTWVAALVGMVLLTGFTLFNWPEFVLWPMLVSVVVAVVARLRTPIQERGK